jgi:hypothetical protein
MLTASSLHDLTKQSLRTRTHAPKLRPVHAIRSVQQSSHAYGKLGRIYLYTADALDNNRLAWSKFFDPSDIVPIQIRIDICKLSCARRRRARFFLGVFFGLRSEHDVALAGVWVNRSANCQLTGSRAIFSFISLSRLPPYQNRQIQVLVQIVNVISIIGALTTGASTVSQILCMPNPSAFFNVFSALTLCIQNTNVKSTSMHRLYVMCKREDETHRSAAT